MNKANHQRYEFSSIEKRPDFSWPNGKRLAVYLGMNLECFEFGSGEGARLSPSHPQPDVLNYAWRDYGNRVGVWRMLELFNELQFPCTALINSRMYEEAPGVVEAFRKRGDEIAGHGRTNAEKQGVLSEEDERTLINKATNLISSQEGIHPKGWLGPWISQSHATLDLLQEAGYEYTLDWCHDEQPIWMQTRRGRILSVPYPQELNDIPQIVARQKEGEDFANMIVDAFNTMIIESERRPLIMGIALHAYLMGYPHRIPHLRRALTHIKNQSAGRVWFTTAGEINDHFRALGL